MIEGVDISHWQEPTKFNWPALAKRFKFAVCRASYGKSTADKNFKKFADLVRQHGMIFGAYLFYRQIHSVTDQLLLFNKQLELVGGLRSGELLPVLDMEENAVNGDGKPIATKFSADCREIAEAFRHEYGGAILYYSSYFPEWLGTKTRPGDTLWMKEAGYYHWLADYGNGKALAPGKVRTPYTPMWHIHQYTGKGRIAEYAASKVDIDLNVVNPAANFEDLRIKSLIEISDEALEGETGTTERPGGCDLEAMDEGIGKIREGLEVLERARRT